MVSKATRTGKGQSLALVILAGIDIMLGVIAIAVAISAGWPGLEALSSGPTLQSNLIVGTSFLILMGQVVLRLAMLIVTAWWSLRLVSHAHRHTRFPISTRWAWLGWFIPVVSLWLPARAVLNLNLKLGRLPDTRRLLILSWWVARLLISPMLGFVSFMVAAALAGLTPLQDTTGLTINWFVWIMTAGIVAQSLGIAVVIITQRHQPKPGEIIAAELF
jgi:hypothetical protein